MHNLPSQPASAGPERRLSHEQVWLRLAQIEQLLRQVQEETRNPTAPAPAATVTPPDPSPRA